MNKYLFVCVRALEHSGILLYIRTYARVTHIIKRDTVHNGTEIYLKNT